MKRQEIVVPPLTPFTRDFNVDFDALKHMVDHVVEDCHASMVVAAGVEAQEYQLLDLQSRKELIQKTIEFVDGRCPVIAGISHPSVKTAVELAHFAERQGAASVQLLAPLRHFGGQPSTGELISYYQAVGREIALPIVLYLNASSGANVSIPGTIELARLDCIRYIKESSRDLARVARLIEEIDHTGHASYFTTMQMLLITMMLGGSGVTLPPPAAKLAYLVIKAFADDNVAEAARLQRQFGLYPARWMHHGLAPVMKASLRHMGVPTGEILPPFQDLPKDELESLHSYLSASALMH